MSVGYNMEMDMLLKKEGNKLHELLATSSGLADLEAFQYAIRVMVEVLGFVPHGDGPNKLSDQEIEAALSKVQVMLVTLQTLKALGHIR